MNTVEYNAMLDKLFGDATVYSAPLVVDWQVVDQFPDAVQCTVLAERNERLLRAAAAIDDHSMDLSEDHSELAGEVMRLELKVNLLIELTGQLLGQKLSLPAAVPVRLSSRGVEWSDGRLPQADERLLVSIYLYPSIPTPLQFYGTVFHIEEKSEPKVIVSFHEVGVGVENFLDRFLFRQHRRYVAQHAGRG
ncbi:PilZ domain-containing protein [Porticoccaceae bacterium LTM1]|nr:PilZ domain-containing protein [Porticoccaceae bacterium LTM1]